MTRRRPVAIRRARVTRALVLWLSDSSGGRNSRRNRVKRYLWVVGIAGVAIGCARHETRVTGACHDFTTAPGTLALLPGIEILVRNAQGTPLAARVSLAALDGASQTTAQGSARDSLAFDVYVNSGTYTVHLSSPYY